jgi:hypothetical protein
MWQLMGYCGPKGDVDPNHPRQLLQSHAYMKLGHHVTSIHTPATAQLFPHVPLTPPRITYHLHASCFPIGHSPPCLSFHDQVITVKVGKRVSYSRDGVCLASKILDTDRELSLSHRSTQIGSITLQQTTSSLRKYLLI